MGGFDGRSGRENGCFGKAEGRVRWEDWRHLDEEGREFGGSG